MRTGHSTAVAACRPVSGLVDQPRRPSRRPGPSVACAPGSTRSARKRCRPP